MVQLLDDYVFFVAPSYLVLSVFLLYWKVGISASEWGSEFWWSSVSSDNGNLMLLGNMYISLIVFVYLSVQWLLFGELTRFELRKLCHRCAYHLFDLLAITAIIGPSTDSLINWNTWLLTIIAMSLLCHLSQLRLKNMVTYALNVNWNVYFYFVTMQILILFLNLYWFLQWYKKLELSGNMDRWLLGVLSSLNLYVVTLQSLIKYAIYFLDISWGGKWEKRGQYSYMTDFFAKIIMLVTSFINYSRLLLYILKTRETSIHYLVLIAVHISFLGKNLVVKLRAYYNYQHLMDEVSSKYQLLVLEDSSDSCAICLYLLKTAKKLPCGHIFHESCLRSWLEHSHTCPTCRAPLISVLPQNTKYEEQRTVAPSPSDVAAAAAAAANVKCNENNSCILKFTSPQLSFLPQLSFEVIRDEHDNNIHDSHQNDPQLVEMMRIVSDIFPNLPQNAIYNDLCRTKSPDVTISNICDGLLDQQEYYNAQSLSNSAVEQTIAAAQTLQNFDVKATSSIDQSQTTTSIDQSQTTTSIDQSQTTFNKSVPSKQLEVQYVLPSVSDISSSLGEKKKIFFARARESYLRKWSRMARSDKK